jgi:hypothetical protein
MNVYLGKICMAAHVGAIIGHGGTALCGFVAK